MQRREAAHGEADDVGDGDVEMVEHGRDVIGGAVLAVGGDVGGHVGGRVAAGVVGDGAVALTEMAQLRLPASVIAGELVDEDDRHAAAGFLEIEFHSVIGGGVRHDVLPWVGGRVPPAGVARQTGKA